MDSKSVSTDMPPPARVLQLLFGEFISKSLMVAAQLNIAEILAAESMTADQLARRVEAEAQPLHRLLRGLASVGVFQEHEGGRFSNTDLSNTLRSEVLGSMKAFALFLCGGPMWSAWGELAHSVRTGRSAFEKVHGHHAFDYMARHPEFAHVFRDAMTGLSQQEVAAIHARFDFGDIRTLVDVAGGQGALLVSCLKRYPRQRGILFDTPGVVASSRSFVETSGVADRCEFVGGDFFKEVPSGADAYMMKYILHDWKDTEALAILRTIHRAARKGTRLFVMDAIIEPGNAPDFRKLMDLQMLVFYDGGRERTSQEFSELFRAAGFRLVRITPTETLISIIEAECV